MQNLVVNGSCEENANWGPKDSELLFPIMRDWTNFFLSLGNAKQTVTRHFKKH